MTTLFVKKGGKLGVQVGLTEIVDRKCGNQGFIKKRLMMKIRFKVRIHKIIVDFLCRQRTFLNIVENMFLQLSLRKLVDTGRHRKIRWYDLLESRLK